MQTTTFLQKVPLGRRTWRALAALLTIMLGFGSQMASAAVIINTNAQTVIVNQGNGNNSYAEVPFNGSTLVDQKTNSTTTPAFDINTGTLILNGGTISTVETGNSVVNAAYIDYTLSDANGDPIPMGTGVIQLMQTASNVGSRTFSLSNANISLISLIQTAGTGYSISVSFRATYRNGASNTNLTARDENGGAGYTANFDVTGTRTAAPALNPSNIQVAADGNITATNYYFPNTGTNPQFPGYTFSSSQNAGGTPGAFDVNNGQLRLLNTVVTTNEAGPNKVSGVVLYYRTRLVTDGGGAFQPITLVQSGATASDGTRTFVIDPTSTNNNNSQPNLIATPAVTTTGNYVVDVYYQASGINSTSGTPFSIVYPPTGYSTANFTVGGTPIATTIWTGGINDNWFDPGNWSAGVPTATTNALIRDLGAGNSVPYPNIYSNTIRTINDIPNGVVLYDNSKSGPAQTLNFIMGGTSQASRSIGRLVVGQLQVFGDFVNTYDSFIQRDGTIMEFAGGNQNITGGTFARVDISGGGTKTLGTLTGVSSPRTSGVMTVSESLNFLTPNVYTTDPNNPLANNPFTNLAVNAGVLSTDITSPSANYISLGDQATNNFNNGAQLNGENDVAFLYGFVRTTRQAVTVNKNRTYSNMGLELNFINNSPGNVEVTRNTVEAYAPLAGRFGIRRIFGVRPSDPATNSGGLNATMVFHYRDSETINLNGPDTRTPGTGSIPEERLTIFVSQNSGNTFSLIGRDGPVDQTSNTVTRTGVTTFATFTLGDIDNPLPVSLVSFTATRTGTSALLNWVTASEQNNTGFEVQVSTDGATFRKLAFVASQNSNSTQKMTYSYADAETGKAGVRYYRLRQIDTDGTSAFSPVRALSFTGNASITAVTGYPNPFTSTVAFNVDATAVGDGVAHVQLVDMTGRIVREQDLTVANASLTMNGLDGLNSGLYLAKITLPDGTTQKVRIQKQ